MGAQIIRSLVFTPAHVPDIIRDHATRGMDALCFDLEDLTPREGKEYARTIFRDLAAELVEQGLIVFARTNGLDDGMAAADLEAIVSPDLHCVSLPKVEEPEQVEQYEEWLAAAEEANGVEPGSTRIRPIIETATGVLRAHEIAAASTRVEYIGGVAGGWWGDLGTSVGYVPDDGRETFYIRSKVVVDVRAAGVRYPIGGGVTAHRDPQSVRAFAHENKVLGYTGAHCKGDRETIAITNEVFSPSPEEVERLQRLLPQLEKAEREGAIATEVEGQLVDTVGIRRVHETLDLARRIGMLDA